jgi:probable F420-dependent oxidoreductase
MSGSPTGAAHPPIDASLPVFDVWVYFGYLAARTNRIRLGTYVYNIGLRHPFITARAVATADRLSGGRVDLGLGVGWLREEWDAVGLDFRTRGRRFEESIAVCHRLWSDESVEFHGEFDDFDPVKFEPKPVQRPMPLLFGGDTELTLRRAARLGGGWVPLSTPDTELRVAIGRFRDYWEGEGRAPNEVRVVRASHRAGSADIARLSSYGVTDVVVAPWERSADVVDALCQFAQHNIAR